MDRINLQPKLRARNWASLRLKSWLTRHGQSCVTCAVNTLTIVFSGNNKIIDLDECTVLSVSSAESQLGKLYKQLQEASRPPVILTPEEPDDEPVVIMNWSTAVKLSNLNAGINPFGGAETSASQNRDSVTARCAETENDDKQKNTL